ncbi:MAG TPA: hypothetical protein VN952_11725, partial [Chthoniobacterales bacterium]|nr:hypothetical protein [Chthoniobacterales bacterium]
MKCFERPLPIVALIALSTLLIPPVQVCAAVSDMAGVASPDDDTGLVVQVRSRQQPARTGRVFLAELDDEIIVDVRAPERFFHYLIDRGVLNDPREPKDVATRDAEKKEEENANALPEEKKSLALKNLAERRDRRFKTEMDDWLQRMSLFVDGHPMPGLSPEWIYNWSEPSADPNQPPVNYYALEYRLRKTDENRDAWFDLLRGNFIFDRPAVISVGFNKVVGDRKDMVRSAINLQDAKDWQRFKIRVAPPWKLALSCVIIILLVALCLALGHNSDLLRDITAPLNPGGRHPF